MKKILIIEDDDFLRRLIITKLEKSGFEVFNSIDGEDGLKSIKKNNPDLIILDLLLPRKHGFELLEEMQKDENIKNIKVIIFSNLGSEQDIKRGKDFGVQHYLIKSNFTLDELVEKVNHTLK